MGAEFGQDVEPAGKYMLEAWAGARATTPGWEMGEIEFQNPLYIEFGGDYRDSTNWKHKLASKYLATGKKLSKKLINSGYDGIITLDKNGQTSEIVDLSIIHGKP
tara:strand:+ start:243 stop:557 length:315 start_codon:yes stop_codon:yes gene_type:complete